MKILSVVWTVQDDMFPKLKGDLTGGAILIRNICDFIGRSHESYLLIGSVPIDTVKVGNIRYVTNGLTEGIYKNNAERLKRDVLAFKNAIDNIQPDFVNFHGEGDFICACIRICQEWNIPFVVSVHLYVARDQVIPEYEKAKKYWTDLFEIPNVKYIAVSSGLKNRILSDYPQIPEKSITVIKNGTDYVAEYGKCTIREDLKLGSAKILLMAGTINARKNQMQVVRAFSLLPDNIKDGLRIIFCGVDRMGGKLTEAIQREKLDQYLKYVGPVLTEDMGKYYFISDGYIMSSLAEGLSISLLEAIRFGIPLIMFSDSECALDLCDERVAVFADKRSDAKLADAIVEWYKKAWDREFIKKYSENFTMEEVVNNYIKYYIAAKKS